MESVWYYVVNGDRVGPVTFAELKAAAGTGKLGPADLVWQEGTTDWVAARTIAGLLSTTPPPEPSQSDEGTYALVPVAPARPTGNEATLTFIPESEKRPKPAAEALSLDDEAPALRRKRGSGSDANDRFAEVVELAQMFVRRMIDPDPSAIAPTTEEGAKLTASGIMDATARKLAVWRRSVLFVAAVPCAFAAVLGFINTLAMSKEERELLSAFGILLQYVQALALFALPVAAVLGALAYDRLAVSTKWVLGGGVISIAVPLVIAFTPTDWLIDLKIDKSASVGTAEAAHAVSGILLGVAFYMALMPAVMSLLPAVARACVRMKLFLPESLVPGWGLVTSVPLCVLLTLATFVVIYHVASNMLLVLGLLLWIGAPLVYFTKFNLFTRPLTAAPERAAIARTSFTVFVLIATGVGLLLIYLLTGKFAGQTILGFSKEAIIRPWTLDLHKIWIDYLGRSLFLTVFFSDLLLHIALSVWREERAFAASPEAAGFDRTMTGLGSAVLPR